MKLKKEEIEHYRIPHKFNEGDEVVIKSGDKNIGLKAKITGKFSSMLDGPKYYLEFEDSNLDCWVKESILLEEE